MVLVIFGKAKLSLSDHVDATVDLMIEFVILFKYSLSK